MTTSVRAGVVQQLGLPQSRWPKPVCPGDDQMMTNDMHILQCTCMLSQDSCMLSKWTCPRRHAHPTECSSTSGLPSSWLEAVSKEQG